MKLIDILVLDLDKFGGWPEGAVECVRYVDEATIDFYDEHGNWPDDCSLIYGPIAKAICITPTEPYQRETVKFSEYEAALAASKPEWDGEDFPPVGCECEYVSNGSSWGKVKIIGHDGGVVVFKPGGEGYYGITPSEKSVFLPIRSEADKKRDETIKAIDDAQSQVFDQDSTFSEYLYDAITAGKIPHIRID
ncbi:hypothetical protein [Yokenella regensburgei]|uniref:hypothetical protein n=1 Tax=Yokenella regensburgei TaxID=158877 RepID=UPI00143293DF|nr:hypothetical protein [Yokenella regensburgei]QIU92106.1 hypothetical protein HEC60_23630 [Yokenella regensburgei]